MFGAESGRCSKLGSAVNSAKRTKEKQQNRTDYRKNMFIEAISKQWNAWQETQQHLCLHSTKRESSYKTLTNIAFKTVRCEDPRTSDNPMIEKASTRIVVPTCADPDVLELRRGSPTNWCASLDQCQPWTRGLGAHDRRNGNGIPQK